MSLVEKFLAGAFLATIIYLLVTNSSGVNEIFKSLANFNVGTFGTLQGRNVSGSEFSVSGSGSGNSRPRTVTLGGNGFGGTFSL